MLASSLSGLGVNDNTDGLLRDFIRHCCSLYDRICDKDRGFSCPLVALLGLLCLDLFLASVFVRLKLFVESSARHDLVLFVHVHQGLLPVHLSTFLDHIG